MEFCQIAVGVLACPAIAIGATAAAGGQMQTTFEVTSSVSDYCTVTAVELDLGSYDGAQNDRTGSISVTCTQGIAYRVGLDNGLHYRAPNRRLKHRTAAYYLIYELYRDPGRTARWGNDDASSVHMIGDGAAQQINIYGRVPANQTGPTGAYSNTTTVTVNF